MERLAQDPPVAGLAGAHVRAVRLDPRAERHVVVGQGGHEQRQLVGRGRHVRIGEDDQVRGRVEHAGPDRRALAAVGDAEQAQGRAVRAVTGRLGPSLDDVDGRVRAAVVDDEDLDGLGEPRGAERTVTRQLAATVQVAEQLVERRADPVGLVVRRQNDREARARLLG